MSSFNDIWNNLYASINAIDINSINSIFRLMLSLLLGSIVGYERKRKGQTAGVRTFSLIAMGATLAMLLSIYVPQEYLGLKNGDPGRIAAQVITGVGFLGAGAIIQMKGSVRGLTTAAGIWMVATIGMAVGVGMYWVSIAATALILFILVQLEKIEHRISLGSESRIIRITASTIIRDLKPYIDIMSNRRMHLSNFYVEYDFATEETMLNLVVLVRENTDYLTLFKELEEVFPTKSIALTNQLAI